MLSPPLVSVIVINRNYGRFVGATIDSIRCQDYPWFQCLIVDNASTDDSRTVIARGIEGDPRFSVLHLDKNLGQLGAAVHVFDRIEGDFVALVDADDVLFPGFLSSHIQVHLGVPEAVGLTSSNVIEIDAEDRVLVGSRAGFGRDCRVDLETFSLSPLAPRLGTTSFDDYAALSAAVAVVSHSKVRWVWGPGTANVYRRSVLATALPDDAERINPGAAWDAYAIPIIHLMTGSVLIFRRLSAYRIHGENFFGSTHKLNAMGNLDKGAAEKQRSQRLCVLHTFLANSHTFEYLLEDSRFWPTVDRVGKFDGLGPRRYFAQDDVVSIVAKAWPSLLQTFGPERLVSELGARMNAVALGRLIDRAYDGEPPENLQAWLLKTSRKRRLRKWIRSWAN